MITVEAIPVDTFFCDLQKTNVLWGFIGLKPLLCTEFYASVAIANRTSAVGRLLRTSGDSIAETVHEIITAQSFQINRYGLVVTHPAVVLYRR